MKHNLKITEPDVRITIPAEQYGHFAEHLGRCIYGGIWDEQAGCYRENVVNALKKLHIPVLRWPGGCFADTYHWRDGIGAPDKRPQNINTVWGYVPETNRFGTHEFFDLCEILGCKPYLAVNMGSGTVQEMADWIHYITSDFDTSITQERRNNGRKSAWKLPYLGIGNEAWGGGGNMTADFYADQYRRWHGFAKSYDLSAPTMKIACGPNGADYDWTECIMQRVDNSMLNGLALHFYTVPSGIWEEKGDATDFSEDEYFGVIRGAEQMEEIISKHCAIMDEYDPELKVALVVDEWGTWYDPREGENPAFLYQQNTMRDAMLAALTLHVFHRHCDRVKLANLAQAVNVLQALILTDGDQMLLTPTYHVFDMMQEHQDAVLYDIKGICGDVSVIASEKNGNMLISLCNPTLAPQTVSLNLPDFSRYSAQILHHEDYHAHNTFDAPENVIPNDFTDKITQNDSELTLTLPPVSLVTIHAAK